MVHLYFMPSLAFMLVKPIFSHATQNIASFCWSIKGKRGKSSFRNPPKSQHLYGFNKPFIDGFMALGCLHLPQTVPNPPGKTKLFTRSVEARREKECRNGKTPGSVRHLRRLTKTIWGSETMEIPKVWSFCLGESDDSPNDWGDTLYSQSWHRIEALHQQTGQIETAKPDFLDQGIIKGVDFLKSNQEEVGGDLTDISNKIGNQHEPKKRATDRDTGCSQESSQSSLDPDSRGVESKILLAVLAVLISWWWNPPFPWSPTAHPHPPEFDGQPHVYGNIRDLPWVDFPKWIFHRKRTIFTSKLQMTTWNHFIDLTSIWLYTSDIQLHSPWNPPWNHPYSTWISQIHHQQRCSRHRITRGRWRGIQAGQTPWKRRGLRLGGAWDRWREVHMKRTCALKDVLVRKTSETWTFC